MRKHYWSAWLALTTASVALLAGVGDSAAQEKSAGADPKQWNQIVEKGVAYLKSAQNDDGSWGPKGYTQGVTGVALTGLLKSGKVTAKDPAAAKSLKYIESLINPKAGHIAGNDAAVKLQNYVTSINVMALVEADRDSYKSVIGDATKFLKKLQWDDGEDKTKKSDFFGGAGYDSRSRPDLSNTQFFIAAMRAAGIPEDDPALRKALIFVSRCQNLKSENNDQPWAGAINDGSFIYSAAGGGSTKVQDKPGPKGQLPGYGSMTYAGIKSMIYCGVDKDDPRMKKAIEWIKNNYTLDANPGMPKVRSQMGLYYYYHTMAKCLDALGVDTIVDAKGKKHDWRKDITEALAKRQEPDGSWVNDQDRWLEGDPRLVTGYALMALSYCKPKK